MPGSSYRLCGFASGVDCRAVHFKDPLPPARICGLCGFVPDKIAFLPCSHLICESCLQGCVDGDVCGCPMDETTFQVDADISWITPPRHHLSKLQVFCWNMENGCDFVGPAEKLLHHFEQECSFHSVSCPRCHDTVLRKDAPHHCKAGCTPLQSPAAPVGKKAASSRAGKLSEKAPSSYHDILAVIRTGVNEVFEAVSKMSLELSGSKEHCEGIVEEQPPQVSQSLCNLSNTPQGASSSVHRATSSAERATFGITIEHDFTGPAEDCIVLAYAIYLCEDYRNSGEVDNFKLYIDGEVTNIEIHCMVSRKAQFVCLSAKLTEPSKWCLPDIEPLLSTQPRPSSLKGIVYRTPEYVTDVDNCLRQGFLVRSISKMPSSSFFKDTDTVRKILSFLVRMKRSDIRNA